MLSIKASRAGHLRFITLFLVSVLLPSCDCLFNTSKKWTANQIAYRLGDTIYLMCLDTGATRKLIAPAWGQFRWSRDGQWLAYDGPDRSEEGLCIYTVDRQGENKRLVICEGQDPIWSPEGDRIAYVSSGCFALGLIYIVELDTDNGITPLRLNDSMSTEILLDWSPAGNRLLYKTSLALDGTCDASADVYSVNPDGSDKRRILELTSSLTVVEMRYSPDGNRIAFIRSGTIWDIYVMNADGSDTTRITDNDLKERSLSWSPDGFWLVFTANLSSNLYGHIYMIRSDGRDQMQITSGEPEYYGAEWRPY